MFLTQNFKQLINTLLILLHFSVTHSILLMDFEEPKASGKLPNIECVGGGNGEIEFRFYFGSC